MVIFYNKINKEILYTESQVMTPTIPEGDIDAKLTILNDKNIAYVGIPYEVDLEIFSYKVSLNDKGEFIGIQPKGGV